LVPTMILNFIWITDFKFIFENYYL
ncbi:rod shape-determining protein MreD, partial [Streptococcus pneumoniae]